MHLSGEITVTFELQKLELQEKISDDSCSKSVEYGNVEYESERSIVTPKNSNRVPVSCQRASRECKLWNNALTTS